MNRLAGKLIVVTGGTGLIGKRLVEQAAAEGAVCINADVQVETDLDRGSIRCDITDPASVDRMIAALEQKFGRIDGLVNNAYPRTKDWGAAFEDIPFASWKQNVDMQMNSIFYLCQQAGAMMKRAGRGSIVNVASIYGVVGPDFSVYAGTSMTMPAAYSAIKGGIINFTRYLASYYGPYGVRINAVSPGGIANDQPEVFRRNYEAKVPMRRLGTPDDIAAPVCFLLSDEAKYITGHNLVVDGGWTSI